MSPILVGINGTSGDTWGTNTPDRAKQYDLDFHFSFVSRICRPGPDTMYLRGPGWAPANNGLLEAVWQSRDFIVAKRKAGVKEPILLTGYSRGAAGVIVVAQMLAEPNYNIDIDAMLLFDCVARDLRISTDRVPANVKHVLHVVRSAASHSRGSFGHSGMLPVDSSRTDYARPKEFDGTHGAMGGTPWTLPPGASPHDFISEGYGAKGVKEEQSRVTYEQDAILAEKVQSYVKPWMSEHGFPPFLQSISYYQQLLLDIQREAERKAAAPPPTQIPPSNVPDFFPGP